MNIWVRTILIVTAALLLSACQRSEPAGKPISGLPRAGALYSFNDGEGGYRVAKVLAVEDETTFVNLFSQRWTKRPALAEARKGTAPIPVAYSATTLGSMQLVHLEDGQVTAEELQLYEVWKRGSQEVF